MLGNPLKGAGFPHFLSHDGDGPGLPTKIRPAKIAGLVRSLRRARISWHGACMNAIGTAYQQDDMAKKTVAELLVDVLAEAGIERVYGVPGDSLNGITNCSRVMGDPETSVCK